VRSQSSYATFQCDPLLIRSGSGGERSPVRQPASRFTKKWIWFAAAAAFTIIDVAVLGGFVRFGRGTHQPAALRLSADDRDGLIRIEWNRSSEPVLSATKASLTIADGNRGTETALSPDLLKTGSVLYRRKSGDVEISLHIEGSKSGPAKERLRMLGMSPIQVASASSPEPDPARLMAADTRPLAAPLASGRLLWTGRLPARSVLRIEGNRASTGYLTGRMPQAPFRIHARPATISGSGIQIFADALPERIQVNEPLGPGNRWNRAVYKLDPKRAAGLVVIEAPSGQNHWKTLRLRSVDRPVTAIAFDWEALPAER